MSDLIQHVLDHLSKVGFTVRDGSATPFDEKLPLVTGVAWEKRSAQLALLAEGNGRLQLSAWRQLLFASSGIRYQLSGEDSSAFGTPVVIAIVDGEAEGQLRELAENLAEDFAIFSRVDLNIVPESHVMSPGLLDDALAPLLPRCRRLLGTEISRQEVQKFWELLRGEVNKAAAKLDEIFGAYRGEAGRDGAEALIGQSADTADLPTPAPIRTISISRFRSIESLELRLADVNVVHGPNGSGKTSLVEALELAWSGTSERKPADVSVEDYAAHLPREGRGEFAISADGQRVDAPTASARSELSRCVLTHEAIAALASDAPKDRFSALLEVTGLEIPDLKMRTEALLRGAKQEADRALSGAGMANLPRANVVALKHLRDELGADFVDRLSALPDIGDLEKALAGVSSRGFERRDWPSEVNAESFLAQADEAVSGAVEGNVAEEEIARVLDEAVEAVGALVVERSRAAAAGRRLLEQLREQVRALRAGDDPAEEAAEEEFEPNAPIGIALAARWLRHSEALKQSSDQFRSDASQLEDEAWEEKLRAYASALEEASRGAPVDELRLLSRPAPPPVVKREVRVDPEVQRAFGFSDQPIDAETVGPVLRQLTDALETHAMELQKIVARLERHPARGFRVHEATVMRALCRFELARVLRREGPILQASERLVSQLLDERLAPAVRELVAAIVRFDWYFKPLKMSSGSRSILLGGLATDREDLDARLLLNSAEQTVLGLAWFLALHMLQPIDRRQVLVLDDPTAVFDNANTAGFASTLRAFVRLLRPKQVVVATHDDRVAAMLAEELASVDGWPNSVTRVRFRRNAQDSSEAIEDWARDVERQVESESELLGLTKEVTG